MSTTIAKTVFFNASKETVWSFLTDKDKLGEWYHPAESNLVEGETYTLFQVGEDGVNVPLITGEVLQMKAPDRLVTTFLIAPFNDNATTVTWQLEGAADGTRLHLSHEGIAEAAGAGAMHLLMALDEGWDKHIVELRRSVANA